MKEFWRWLILDLQISLVLGIGNPWQVGLSLYGTVLLNFCLDQLIMEHLWIFGVSAVYLQNYYLENLSFKAELR